MYNRIKNKIANIEFFKEKGHFNSNIDHPDQHYGGRTYSQHGDDLIVINIFRSIGIEKPSYIDVGAHHPYNISNTALLYERGSRGVNIEANPHLFENFVKCRPEDKNLNIAISDKTGELPFYMIDKWSGRNSFDKQMIDEFIQNHPHFKITEVLNIPVHTLSEIISSKCSGIFPDFLSIDIEGLDGRVLKTINYEQSKPKVICCENPNSEIFSFLDTKGYFPLIRASANIIFILKEYDKLARGLEK